MSERIFPTAKDAENAFYDALERADVEAMMAVWSEDDDIVCVHPSGQRVAGQAQVREAWRRMFAPGPHMRVRVAQQVVVAGVMLEIRSVEEHITLAGEPRARPSPRRANSTPCWKMAWVPTTTVASPAAAAAGAAGEPPAPAAPTQTLH